MKPRDEVGNVAYGGEARFHQLQPEEDHAYAHGRHAGVAQFLVFHEEVQEGRDAHERQAVLAHVYDEYPAGDGGADVRAHYDAYGLLQAHYPGVDEPDGHDGGYGRGLYEACDERPHAGRHEAVVGDHPYELAQTVAGDGLEAVGHVLHAEEEYAKPAYDVEYQMEDVLAGHQNPLN